jgi:hypothetical protein
MPKKEREVIIMAETKITKREVLNKLVDYARENGNEMFENYAIHELELLDKKIASGKKNAINEANEKLKDTIVSVLTNAGKYLSIKEIQASDSDLSVDKISNQKINALLVQLRKENRVDRDTETDKKRTLFGIK